MSAAKRVGSESVRLSEEQIHLIAKALADPRRFECCGRLGAVPSQCNARTSGVSSGECGDAFRII